MKKRTPPTNPGLAMGLASAALLGGCAVAAPPQVDAVHTSAQCPLTPQRGAMGVQMLQDGSQWQVAFGPQSADTLLGRPVDWAKKRVVVFSLGRQPTLGVSVELASRSLSIQNDVLQVPVTVRRPGPDQMAAMALSWPCVIAAVPRKGWTQVRVTNEKGEVLAATAASR